MKTNIKDVIINEEEIANKVSELAVEIQRDYAGKKLLVIGVLKGASVFLADLIRKLDLDIRIDFISASSYGMSSISSGEVKIDKDLDYPINGENILIVEDIIDTGLTLKYLVDNLSSRAPADIKICTLLDKPSRREVNIAVDYIGFEIPDRFIVGYGIDYAEKYRNLPYIAVIEE